MCIPITCTFNPKFKRILNIVYCSLRIIIIRIREFIYHNERVSQLILQDDVTVSLLLFVLFRIQISQAACFIKLCLNEFLVQINLLLV
jgi:hypothetical protein